MNHTDIVQAEAAACRAFTLHVDGLPIALRDHVRTQFVAIAARSVRLTIESLGRSPTDKEIDLLRSAVTRFCNQTLIPQLRDHIN